MGPLYIVATPIGNLQDTSIRVATLLTSVDLIACEDTRRTGIFLNELKKLPITVSRDEEKRPYLLSYYEHNELQRIPQLLEYFKKGARIALISDAGTPIISDPGFKLVRACIKEGIRIESIPGPSAVITALTISGLPPDKFLFLGFLPHKIGHRKTLLEHILKITAIFSQTVIFYEAPHKLIQTLQELKEALGDIQIVVCRELTKIHEEIRRETISQALAHFTDVQPKGEYVILFNRKE